MDDDLLLLYQPGRRATVQCEIIGNSGYPRPGGDYLRKLGIRSDGGHSSVTEFNLREGKFQPLVELPGDTRS